jgi:succinyl-diaminopimelate desuccinylase
VEPDPESNALPSHCVPDSCRIIIDRRFLIEENVEEVKAEIEDLLEGIKSRRPKFKYEVTELNRVIPSMTDKEAPIVKSIAASIEKVLGKIPDYVASPGSYDQKHIDRIGTLKNCIAYGPGILDLAHKPDEFVVIDDMVDSAKVMGNSLIDLLTS